MLLKIYEFITKLQAEIGNAAEVWLLVRGDVLELRVDWLEEDLHTRQNFSKFKLDRLESEDVVLDNFIAWCRSEYASKKKAE